jgi:CheY-like chemotaxis protein
MVADAQHTVLIVEDELILRELLAEVLRDEGYTVEEAEDGAEALQVLNRYECPASSLCLVLLDMMLPRVDGSEVLRQLSDRGSRLPVAVMSASTRHLAEAREAGVSVTLAKPFEIDDMLAVVSRYCPR